MDPTTKTARTAGFLYILASLTAPFSLVWLPGHLIVSGSATATGDHLRASETLLRWGMASEVFGSVVFIYVVLTLYRLFKPVNETHALAMMVLMLVSIPISLFSIVAEVGASMVSGGGAFLQGFDQRQLDAIALLLLRLHGEGIGIAVFFWGLWLFPFGLLVIRCGFIPRLLGYLLLIAGVGYLTNAAVGLVFPSYQNTFARLVGILQMGELPIILWLAIWGTRPQRVVVSAS